MERFVCKACGHPVSESALRYDFCPDCYPHNKPLEEEYEDLQQELAECKRLLKQLMEFTEPFPSNVKYGTPEYQELWAKCVKMVGRKGE